MWLPPTIFKIKLARGKADKIDLDACGRPQGKRRIERGNRPSTGKNGQNRCPASARLFGSPWIFLRLSGAEKRAEENLPLKKWWGGCPSSQTFLCSDWGHFGDVRQMSRAAQRDVGMLWQSAQKEKHHDWPISIIVFVPFYMEQFFVWQYASIHVGFCSDSLPEISHPPQPA